MGFGQTLKILWALARRDERAPAAVEPVRPVAAAFPEGMESMEFDGNPRGVYASDDYGQDAMRAAFGLGPRPGRSPRAIYERLRSFGQSHPE